MSPDPLRAPGTDDEPVRLMESLRRANPTVDSPLGELIARRISLPEYVRRIDRRRTRMGLRPMNAIEIEAMKAIVLRLYLDLDAPADVDPQTLMPPGATFVSDDPLPRARSGQIAALCLIACALLVVLALWRTA